VNDLFHVKRAFGTHRSGLVRRRIRYVDNAHNAGDRVELCDVHEDSIKERFDVALSIGVVEKGHHRQQDTTCEELERNENDGASGRTGWRSFGGEHARLGFRWFGLGRIFLGSGSRKFLVLLGGSGGRLRFATHGKGKMSNAKACFGAGLVR
jgi:hypothetical protein